MDFGPVRTPKGVDLGGANPAEAQAASRRAPTEAAQAQAGAAQSAAAARPPDEPKMRTVGDAQRLAGFLRATADDLAASEAGTEGDGGPGQGADYGGSLPQIVTQVEKHAERIFRSILEYAGDDRRLLEQAKGYVAKVFEEFRERDPEPMLARMTHDRVIDLIEARLRDMREDGDVDFSA
ncbi:MAG: hypothetical protein FJZ01_26395 [Candidatus Sericytochromatia bacterium]|nr:hypothetical protein [Candidatus Tanganyikabacteria bacterium]